MGIIVSKKAPHIIKIRRYFFRTGGCHAGSLTGRYGTYRAGAIVRFQYTLRHEPLPQGADCYDMQVIGGEK